MITYYLRFFPASGIRNLSGIAEHRARGGFYWASSSNDPSGAWRLDFGSGGVYPIAGGRIYGFSLRCVACKV